MFKSIIIGVSVVALILVLALGSQIFENVDADRILVVQHPTNGTLSWYFDPGIQWQGFGKVTQYQKLSDTNFDSKVMFNDNGTGHLRGKFQVKLPLNAKQMTALHTQYGSQKAIEESLVKPTINKVIYMTGPLMSSKESSAERKTDLIRYIIDEIEHGVYRTTQKTVTIEDPISKEKRSNVVADIVLKDGRPERQEESSLNEFGIAVVNFAPSDLEYDDAVKAQIKTQQSIVMQVQTARAQALEAEQRRITAQANGEAEVMKSRYVKEQEKIQAVVDAQKELEVATLNAKAAEQTKRQNILLGEGEAERKKLVMNADGALDKKLDALVKINEHYANAIATYTGAWVPAVVMGNGASGSAKSGGGAQDLIDMLSARTASQLAVDVTAGGLARTQGK